jgi:hypothetical protein
MVGLQAIMDAVAGSLTPLTSVITGLQITAFVNPNPTPPSVDVYPASVSMVPASMAGWEETLTVRARVSSPDDTGAQQLLLSLMDVDSPASVMAALRVDPTFGGVVGGSAVDERSGFNSYPGDYLGCEWLLRTIQ